jgi:hypothetical protein
MQPPLTLSQPVGQNALAEPVGSCVRERPVTPAKEDGREEKVRLGPRAERRKESEAVGLYVYRLSPPDFMKAEGDLFTVH